MFWDAFPGVDLALLSAGFHLGFVDVGNTFGCPDAMKHFDAFYTTAIEQYSLSRKPALEGLSRGGLFAYRWAYVNTGKVSCIYGDAPVCDMKSWPGGKGKGIGSPADWQEAIRVYHFSGEQEMMNFKGNPVDILAPIAAAHIPIIHVCGDVDTTVPEAENTDLVRERYLRLGGDFVLIVKEGCDHHPHGLMDPEPVVNFILAHSTDGKIAKETLKKCQDREQSSDYRTGFGNIDLPAATPTKAREHRCHEAVALNERRNFGVLPHDFWGGTPYAFARDSEGDSSVFCRCRLDRSCRTQKLRSPKVKTRRSLSGLAILRLSSPRFVPSSDNSGEGLRRRVLRRLAVVEQKHVVFTAELGGRRMPEVESSRGRIVAFSLSRGRPLLLCNSPLP